MKDLKIRVWQEDQWFLAEVVDFEEDYYAQGLSYGDVLANLFSVIEMVNNFKNKRKFIQKLPQKEVNFSIPAFA